MAKAIPNGFKDALLTPERKPSPDLPFAVQTFSRNKGNLYWQEAPVGDDRILIENEPLARIIPLAYCAFLIHMGKWPSISSNDNPSDHKYESIKGELERIARGEIPDWFETGKDFPKVELPASIHKELKRITEKKRQDEEAREKGRKIKADFLQKLNEAVPDNLMYHLLNDKDGYEKYQVVATFGGVYHLYALEGESGRSLIGDFIREECLRAAYIMIMNDRELLPEKIWHRGRAASLASQYAKSESIPGWHDAELERLEL